MKQVRIQPTRGGALHEIDIVCDCGLNNLKNVVTGEKSVRHETSLGGPDITLQCGCGSTVLIHPQRTHFHIQQTV